MVLCWIVADEVSDWISNDVTAALSVLVKVSKASEEIQKVID